MCGGLPDTFFFRIFELSGRELTGGVSSYFERDYIFILFIIAVT